MSKTNQTRDGDKPRRDGERYKHSPPGGAGNLVLLADKNVGAGYGGDNANGHIGYARVKAGAKKYVRTRTRFHENVATTKLSKLLDEDDES